MKTIFTLHGKLSGLLIALVLISAAVANAQTTHVVQVTSNVFTPKNLTIEVGDVVEWQNNQGFHNVNGTTSTYPENPESFGNNVGSGWTYSYTFNTAGSYNYRCDPHAALGMTGTIEVTAVSNSHTLTIHFTDMHPHIGQSFHLWVYDQNDGTELYTTERTVAAEFDVVVQGIETGKSYDIDFYADHNGNDTYDAPPTDHAWRIELNDVTGDTELNFSHNTSFTDIFNVTDVNELPLASFILYPNPATNKVTLEYNGFNINTSVRLLDLVGKTHTVRTTLLSNKVELDISGLPQGLYLIQLQDGDMHQTQKLIKR
ncbi:MAG TPA: plastocyanin/azurin family copper-binding protein [Draconibacterium sp.]|nr:plastocyanin/azurin family copper-binding protein [Draconibacterium sp.]